MEQAFRNGVLAAGGLLVFAFVSRALVSFLQPQRDTDYLLIGALATMACLVTIFAGASYLARGEGVFFKLRRRD